ncbi:uncharacterized protein LOC131856720 [Cryptomeria japonica]|uniref:uncharacterized protein LOC131856720 n=1 Tax=Cryptomeria japonica TaxID=3369 RepID=UPI0027DA9408|nr:uncharacterized protein LOC131856720 [Cryptomeria japonica]
MAGWWFPVVAGPLAVQAARSGSGGGGAEMPAGSRRPQGSSGGLGRSGADATAGVGGQQAAGSRGEAMGPVGVDGRMPTGLGDREGTGTEAWAATGSRTNTDRGPTVPCNLEKSSASTLCELEASFSSTSGI